MKYLDTRDLAKRKAELEYLRDALEDAKKEREQLGASRGSTQEEIDAADDVVQDAESEFGENEAAELAELEELESQISEWNSGETLIPECNFTEYAEQLAEDIGAIDHNASWPLNRIDWEAAADDLKADYTAVEYQGISYLVRA